MNDELQTELTKALAGITEGAATATDFVLAELPDVVTQLLWWVGISKFIYFLIGALFLYGAYRIPLECYRHAKQMDEAQGYYDPVGEITIGFIAPLVCGLIGGILINLQWLQVLVAPKVFLLEYSARLLGAS